MITKEVEGVFQNMDNNYNNNNYNSYGNYNDNHRDYYDGQYTYNTYSNYSQPPKKKKNFFATITKTVAIALVFGLVSGVAFSAALQFGDLSFQNRSI